ncbi:hypothetical protein [Spirillospora sp. CA-294931]|uniref:hypothetical protein n=1 Tax=Spirillospora sp. CA-294931 TaxID=3240042 RepID=UPI003D91F384
MVREGELRRALDDAQCVAVRARHTLHTINLLVSELVLTKVRLARRGDAFQERLAEATRQLSEAQRHQYEAEALRQEAAEQVACYNGELARADSDTAPLEPDDSDNPEPDLGLAPPSDATPEEYDAALEKNTSVLKDTGRVLDDLRHRLDLDEDDDPNAPEHVLLVAGAFAGAILLVVFGVIVIDAYTRPDVPLTYESGDRPRQRVVSKNGDDRGPEAATWSTAPAGRIDTTWSAAPHTGIRALNGALRLLAPDHGKDARCPKAIGGVRLGWAVRLDGTVVATGTIRADLEKRPYRRDAIKVVGGGLATGKAQGRPHVVRLTAQRVDSTPCKADLAWEQAALDTPGPGPHPWQSPHPWSKHLS